MMNLIDEAVCFISPKAYLERAKYRTITDHVRSYEAAARTRRTQNWKAPANSQNDVARLSLPLLRQRSRQLVRDIPYAERAVRGIANNVVGKGIRPAPWADGRKEKQLKEMWKLWGESTECDFNGKMSFYGIQRLVMRAVAESGECLVIRRRVPNSMLGFRLQVLEADYLDHGKDIRKFMSQEGNPVYIGVEYERNMGRPVAYWLYNNHPGEGFTGVSQRIDASEVLHAFETLRPGQVRGIPMGVSAFMRLKDTDEFEDARLLQQKIAAAFGAFVTGGEDADMPKDADTPEKIEPAIIQYLKPGQDITFATPPPASGYSEYLDPVLHAIAVGYGVPYELLTGDLSKVNYSSGRMGWLEFQRNIAIWQEEVMINLVCIPVWGWFITGITSGMYVSGVQKTTAVWTPPRREMVDPESETNAIKEQIRNGLISYSEAVRQMGSDPDDVMEEMASDWDKVDKLKLKLDCDPRASSYGTGNIKFKQSN